MSKILAYRVGCTILIVESHIIKNMAQEPSVYVKIMTDDNEPTSVQVPMTVLEKLRVGCLLAEKWQINRVVRAQVLAVNGQSINWIILVKPEQIDIERWHIPMGDSNPRRMQRWVIPAAYMDTVVAFINEVETEHAQEAVNRNNARQDIDDIPF